jgi:hypothetical protein
MRKVLRVGKDVKAKRSRVKELMDLRLSALEMDMKLQLIQELIPLGLMHIAEVLTEEVEALAGDRYKRNGKPGHVRWSKQWGSVYIGEQKLPILNQRVRDRMKGTEVELTAYKGLQQPHQIDEGLLKKILVGHSAFGYRAQIKQNQGIQIPPRIANSVTNGACHKGKGASSCIMQGRGRYRISTKNGIDSYSLLEFALFPQSMM